MKFIKIIIMLIGLSLEFTYYAFECSTIKECNQITQSRNHLIHDMHDKIKYLKWNIEDYGGTQEVHARIDELRNNVMNLCLDCPFEQKSACHHKQHTLQKKIDKVQRSADQHARK